MSEAETPSPSTRPARRGRRRPLVSANWKMHHDHIVALHTVRDLGLRLKPEDTSTVEVSVHPPFTDLRTVQVLVEGEGLPLALGAQHCHPDDEGAFTGEVSAPMLARLGVRYVIVGHSERRRLFSMTDEQVATTMRAVLRHSMIPILCVGESTEERESGTTEKRLAAQLESALEVLGPEQMATLVIAYEPIWAIGSGTPATPVDAADAAAFIRSTVSAAGGAAAGAGVRVQYGGSVSAENAGQFLAEPDLDGLLVGGASLQATGFAEVIRAVGACYRSPASKA
ncbi:MAG: triose-phosphate isomerase [Acidimicrobiales bacterium]